MTKDVEAASDLWGQVFGRQAEHPNASVLDSGHDAGDDDARKWAGLLAAGWTEDQIAKMDAAAEERIAGAPVTSPGVNPRVEAQHAALCDAVEAAMDRLGMKSQARVARGIEPRVGPYAAKTNVVMTDESIVTVGTFLFRYCGLIARAFTRTLRLDPWLWERADFDGVHAVPLLRADRSLVAY